MPLAYKNLPAFKACIKNIFTATAKSTVNVGVYLPEERTVKLVWADGTVTEGEFTNDATFTESPRLVASDKAASDCFGQSVSISSDGSFALIGAYQADPGGTSEAGAAYVFTRSGSTWAQQAKLVASDKAASDQFGQSVSLSSDGSTALVGAYTADPGGTSDAGAAYIYSQPDDGLFRYLAADRALTNVVDLVSAEAGTLYEYRGLVVEAGETLAVTATYAPTAVSVQVRGFVED